MIIDKKGTDGAVWEKSQEKMAEDLTRYARTTITGELLPQKHSKNSKDTTQRMTTAIWGMPARTNIPTCPETSVEQTKSEDEINLNQGNHVSRLEILWMNNKNNYCFYRPLTVLRHNTPSSNCIKVLIILRGGFGVKWELYFLLPLPFHRHHHFALAVSRVLLYSCLFLVRRFPRPSRTMHFGEVFETKGRVMT